MPKKVSRQGNYKVGYGKPPKHTRFAPGHSGRLKRRPKPKDLRTVLLDALSERVSINENGERKQITKLEAITKQLVNKAAGGHVRAIRYLNELLRDSDNDSGPPVYFEVIDDAA